MLPKAIDPDAMRADRQEARRARWARVQARKVGATGRAVDVADVVTRGTRDGGLEFDALWSEALALVGPALRARLEALAEAHRRVVVLHRLTAAPEVP
jgi:hypothetical protein